MRTARTIGMLVVVLVFGFTAAVGEMGAGSKTKAVSKEMTEVVVLGVLHGFHSKNPYYSKEILRDIIIGCQPSAILVELPVTMYGKATVVEGRLVEKFAQADEGWAEQEAAKKLKVPIFPFDMDRREDVRQEEDYYNRRKKANAEFEKWLQEHEGDEELVEFKAIVEFHADIKKSIVAFASKGTPEIINSEAFDSVLRASKRISGKVFPELFKKYPEKAALGKELSYVGDEWQGRNETMVEKIVSQAKQYPGKRIVVVTGAEHRYILRDMLEDEKGVQLREYWEL